MFEMSASNKTYFLDDPMINQFGVGNSRPAIHTYTKGYYPWESSVANTPPTPPVKAHLLTLHPKEDFSGIPGYDGYDVPRFAAAQSEPDDHDYSYVELYDDGTIRQGITMGTSSEHEQEGVSDLLIYNPHTEQGRWWQSYVTDPKVQVAKARQILLEAGVPQEALDHPLRQPGSGARVSPFAGSSKTPAQQCVTKALRSLQFARWAQYEDGTVVEHRTPADYARALGVLVGRFGEDALASESVAVIDDHLRMLHTPLHTPGGTSKAHSDGKTEDERYTDIAYAAIKGEHYIPNGLYAGKFVNYASLFGDVDFLVTTRNEYFSVFEKVVDHLQNLPVPYVQTHPMYNQYTMHMDPVGLIRDHYPQAYAEIIEARPDFVPQLPVSLAIVSEKSFTAK